ncbi:solute carrier family 22 member 12-like [Amblyomma americanum]
MASQRANAGGSPTNRRRSILAAAHRPCPLDQPGSDTPSATSKKPSVSSTDDPRNVSASLRVDDGAALSETSRASSGHVVLVPATDDTSEASSQSDFRFRVSRRHTEWMIAEDLAAVFGSGRFQLEALLCAAGAYFVMLCHNLLHGVLAPHVDHWCRPAAEYANLTPARWRAISEPLDDQDLPQRCERFMPPLSIMARNRSRMPCDGLYYDVSEHGRTIVSDWNLVCDRRWLVSASFVFYMGGAMLGTLAAGRMADKVGRRPAVLVAVFGLLSCGLGVCFANTFTAFSLLRFGVSASACGVQATTYVLLFEVTARPSRALYCCLVTGVGLAAGPLCVYALGAFSRSWVATQAIIMVPTSLLGVAVIYSTEESPRWLLATWDLKGAERVVLRAASLNRVDADTALKIWRALTSQVLHGPPPSKKDMAMPDHQGYSRLWCSPLLRPVVVVLYWCWSVAILSYYSHVLMRTNFGDTDLPLSCGVAIIQVPASVVTYRSMRRLGRRSTLWLLLCLLSLVSGGAAVMLSVRGHRYPAVVFLYGLTGVLLNQFVMLLFAYSVEVFPTASRGLAVFTANFWGRLGAASAPALIGLLDVLGLGGAVPEMAVLSLMAAITGLGALSLPETKSPVVLERLEEEMDAVKQTVRPKRPVGTAKPAAK